MTIKKPTTQRKHGRKAYAPAPAGRMKTQLTFEAKSQVYCWSTDRGRTAHLIKH